MAIEDFSTYTEVDPNGVLTVTPSKITGVNVDRDLDAYVYKDKGEDNYNEIDIDFELQIESTSDVQAWGGPGLSVATIGTVNSFGTSDISIRLQETGVPAWIIVLERGDEVALDIWFDGVAGTLYYCTLARAAGSDTVTLKIYSDSGRTSLLDTLSVSGYGTGTRYRYLYGFVNKNDSSTGRDFDGFVQNMEDFSPPPPPQDLAVGSFVTTNGSPGATIAITGLRFTPKAIFFFWSAIDNDNNGQNNRDLRGWGYSFAVSPTERGGACVAGDDAQTTTSQEDTRTFNNGVVSSIAIGTATETGRLDLQSMDADGFTLVVDDQFPTTSDNMRVNYIAIGENIISSAKVGEFRTNGSNGNQSITGLGFQPDVVFFIAGMETGAAALPQADQHSIIAFGAAISSSERYVSILRAENGVDLTTQTHNSSHYSFDGECIVSMEGNGNMDMRADFVSMDADGFTINLLESSARRQVQYLAIKGGFWKLFDALTLTSVADLPDIDVGFTAEGGMIVSTLASKNTQDVSFGQGEMSIGAFQDNGTERGITSLWKETDPTQTGSGQKDNRLYTHLNSSFGVEGDMRANAISDNNLKFEQMNADPAANFFWGFATRVPVEPGAAKGMPIFF